MAEEKNDEKLSRRWWLALFAVVAILLIIGISLRLPEAKSSGTIRNVPVSAYNLEHGGKKIVLPEGAKAAYFVMQPQNGCATTSGKLSPECWSQKIEIPDGVWSMVSYPSLPVLTCDEYPGGENSGCPNNPTTADKAGKKVKHISDRVPSEMWFANIQTVPVTIVMQFTY